MGFYNEGDDWVDGAVQNGRKIDYCPTFPSPGGLYADLNIQKPCAIILKGAHHAELEHCDCYAMVLVYSRHCVCVGEVTGDVQWLSRREPSNLFLCSIDQSRSLLF